MLYLPPWTLKGLNNQDIYYNQTDFCFIVNNLQNFFCHYLFVNKNITKLFYLSVALLHETAVDFLFYCKNPGYLTHPHVIDFLLILSTTTMSRKRRRNDTFENPRYQFLLTSFSLVLFLWNILIFIFFINNCAQFFSHFLSQKIVNGV